MALRVTRRPRARKDLLDLWFYIAADSEKAADGMLDRIESVLSMLAEHPEAGRNRDDVSVGLRSFPLGNIVLFYRIQGERLIVSRVLGYGQDLTPSSFVDE